MYGNWKAASPPYGQSYRGKGGLVIFVAIGCRWAYNQWSVSLKSSAACLETGGIHVTQTRKEHLRNKWKGWRGQKKGRGEADAEQRRKEIKEVEVNKSEQKVKKQKEVDGG